MRYSYLPSASFFRSREVVWLFLFFIVFWAIVNWQWLRYYHSQPSPLTVHSDHSHQPAKRPAEGAPPAVDSPPAPIGNQPAGDSPPALIVNQPAADTSKAAIDKQAAVESSKAAVLSPLVQIQPLDKRAQATCGHWVGRNYYQHPIWSSAETEPDSLTRHCDVPCIWNKDTHAAKYVDVVGGLRSGCGHTLTRRLSMEAVYRPGMTAKSDKQMILSYTDLDSDVPAPYFSWAEYGFMEPLVWPKPARSMAAAWISNCATSNQRLEYIKQLMLEGVTIDSFGTCLRNQPNQEGKKNWFKNKIETLKQYKFAIAFENTNLKDYVTEKLFQAFVAGSVPIHMGVADVHKFGPSNRSIISVHDFDSPAALARHLKWLDANPDEYARYLDWKWKGYSPQFQALVDLTSVHTSCRTCIEAADRLRFAVGEPHPSVRPFLEDNPGRTPDPDGEFAVRVRERNKFWFRALWLPNRTALDRATLHDRVAALLVAPRKHEQPSLYVYGVQTRARPHVLLDTDELVRLHVKPAVELEAILLVAPDFSRLREQYRTTGLPDI